MFLIQMSCHTTPYSHPYEVIGEERAVILHTLTIAHINHK